MEVDEWIYHGLYEQPCERIMGEKTGYGHRAVFLTPLLIYRNTPHRYTSSTNILLVISDAAVPFPYSTGIQKMLLLHRKLREEYSAIST